MSLPLCLVTGQLIDELSPTADDYDRLLLLPKIPAPSAQVPKRALSRRSTFRRSNLGPPGAVAVGVRMSTRLSRYSIDYSDYIFDEYGKPSPVVESFFDEETTPILRSISQRTSNHLYQSGLRRTRSSEMLVPAAALSRTDTVGSAPGKRLEGWLQKQEEYFPPRGAGPISLLPSLPGSPTIRRSRSAELQRGASVTAPPQSTSGRKESKKKKKHQAQNDDNSSCVGIPYAAMLTPQKDSKPAPTPSPRSPGSHLGIEVPSRTPSPSPSLTPSTLGAAPPRPPPPRPPPPSEPHPVIEIAPAGGSRVGLDINEPAGMI